MTEERFVVPTGNHFRLLVYGMRMLVDDFGCVGGVNKSQDVLLIKYGDKTTLINRDCIMLALGESLESEPEAELYKSLRGLVEKKCNELKER